MKRRHTDSIDRPGLQVTAVLGLASALTLLACLPDPTPRQPNPGQIALFLGAVLAMGALAVVVLIRHRLKATRQRLSATRRRLTATNAELVQCAPLKGLASLSASIAHEVNQPLTSIVTLSDAGLRWLDRPQPDLAEVRACLARIHEEGMRAAEVVRTTRAIARQEPPKLIGIPIDDLIDEALTMNADLLAVQDITVERGTSQGTTVLADTAQMRQVISNLLSNAIEAMADTPIGSRVVHIEIKLLGDQVEVSVRDRGRGVPAQNQARIFDAFFSTKPLGLGMGLAICRCVIEAHCGCLTHEAAQGPGSIFRFTLPRARS